MNKNEILQNSRCILCDIDGTLYDWSRILSKKTIKVINQLHDKGYIIGLASGRPYEELCLYAKEWGFNLNLILL